jgi:hypothetical protein
MPRGIRELLGSLGTKWTVVQMGPASRSRLPARNALACEAGGESRSHRVSCQNDIFGKAAPQRKDNEFIHQSIAVVTNSM